MRTSAPVQFVPLARVDHPLERWGGGEVEGVVLTPSSVITAGAFGITPPAQPPVLLVRSFSTGPGMEARGFILGGAVAHQLSVGFVPVRPLN